MMRQALSPVQQAKALAKCMKHERRDALWVWHRRTEVSAMALIEGRILLFLMPHLQLHPCAHTRL